LAICFTGIFIISGGAVSKVSFHVIPADAGISQSVVYQEIPGQARNDMMPDY